MSFIHVLFNFLLKSGPIVQLGYIWGYYDDD
jgi:hypothetical protein